MNYDMVWSGANGIMIHRGFTRKGKHYTWNEADEVYYNDENDEDFYFLQSARMLGFDGLIDWDI